MIPISDVRKVSGGVPKRTPAQPKPKRPSVFGDGSPAAAVATALFSDAIASGATAVHIEPYAEVVHVRFRIDGLLHEGKAIPPEALNNVIKRFKHLANLAVAETRLPQDGRFEITLQDQLYVVRVNTLPVTGGEKVVLHITPQSGMPHELEKLGFWGQSLQDLQEAAGIPRGLMLVNGPAGSGKTATLYSLLGLAARPTLSAATVEDAIDHRLAGVIQTPVNTKAHMSFAGTLRAVLSQDPNIVMVGDIREPETASQALQAALGGHLILAGMQSRDIATAVSHLVALHVEPYVVATATKIVVNQRLVRRLCPKCRQTYTPTPGEFDAFCKASGLPAQGTKAHLTNLQSIAAADLNVEPAFLGGNKIPFWRAKPEGCSHCGARGYKGRIAIAEVLAFNPAMQRLVFSNAAGAALYDQAMQNGMVPLPLDGLVKVVVGLTSTDEVLGAMQR